MHGLHELLLRLTRPEGPHLWIGVAIVAGYAVVGLALGGTLGSLWTRLREPGVRRSSR